MRLNRFSFALSFRAPKQPFVFIPVANQLVALKLFRCCKNDGRGEDGARVPCTIYPSSRFYRGLHSSTRDAMRPR